MSVLRVLLLMLLGCIAGAGAGNAIATGRSGVQPEFDDVVRRFASEDGLPQNSITSMVQAPDGFLWLGTFGGLVRFDGLSFRLYRSLAEDGPPSDRILRLHVDGHARLWIGTEDGGVAVLEGDRFQRLPLCGGRCKVNAFIGDGAGHVWVATSAGLFRAGENDLGAVRVDARAYVRGVVQDGVLLLATLDRLWRWTGERADPVALPAGTVAVTGLGRLDASVWIGTNTDFFHYDPRQDRWRPYLDAHTVPDVSGALHDAQGQLWLSDNFSRLFRLDRDDQVHRVEMARGAILSMLGDGEGNLWLGSNGDGLFRRRPAQIGRMQDAGAGFGSAALPVTGDGADGLWLGMICGGLRHWTAHDGRVRDWPLQAALDSNCVWSLHRDADGTLWIGSADGILGRLRPGAANAERVARWPQRPSIRAIARTADGLLVATSAGAYRLDVDARGQTGTPRPIAALGDTTINAIVPARAGGHWFAGHEGVLRLDGEHVAERWDTANGLSSRFARTLLETGDGVLWIGTYGGGLNRIADGRVASYTQQQGLFDDVVSCLIEDGRGQLWLSGNRGISMLTGEQLARAAAGGGSLHALGYAASDGLEPAETNGGGQPACHRDTTGRLWFPTLSGFAVVEPGRLHPPSAQAPTIHIERISAGGTVLPLRARLVLEGGVRNVEISFTAPTFSAPEKIRFRYRLAGGDWIDIGDKRSIHFPVVPWGEQLLQIAASSEAGTWSAHPARLILVNPAPWYLSPPWLAALVLLSGALVYAAWSLRTLRLRRHSDALALLVGERTAALEQANLRLVEQAHSDPLTGVGNHRHFIVQLGEAWKRHQGSARPLSLLLIDVDHFKAYNDHFGHLAGDDALCAIAHAMHAQLRGTAMLARYGGEEFVVLLPDCDIAAAARVGERLRAAVTALALPHAPASGHAHITISVGCACLSPGPDDSRVLLIDQADQALYRAKALGRDRVECWNVATGNS